MSRANEMYHLDRSLATLIKNITKSKDPNKQTLLKFYERSVADGLSLARILKKIYTMKSVSAILGKKFEDATRDDIVKLVATIELKGWSLWTKHDYKAMIKHFFRWLKGKDVYETPVEVRWIRRARRSPAASKQATFSGRT